MGSRRLWKQPLSVPHSFTYPTTNLMWIIFLICLLAMCRSSLENWLFLRVHFCVLCSVPLTYVLFLPVPGYLDDKDFIIELTISLPFCNGFISLNIMTPVPSMLTETLFHVNTKHLKMPEGTRMRGERPGTNWEVDYTEIKPGRYEIFPRFGLPKVGSDNGPAFVSQVSQLVARLLGINWKLHCAYRPQSSGQVERMNRTIKETLTKLTLETGTTDWVQLLPMVLFRVWNTPACHGLTPYEILYGGPPPVTDLLDSAIALLLTLPVYRTG
ncbi:unnamed protein product [Nyctereutes procyonoides]|uniref:(raccoon dog) hypothetical protein n=1 Tax=Nyctereutes procyonoides TaxID=34880 RepID=A0A811XVR0_NYCPR|nr:unnamed protein product [Nyctereutes procyonoides]